MTSKGYPSQANFADLFERYLSRDFKPFRAGNPDRLKKVWNNLCSKDSNIVIDDEFYVANVSHESIFPTIHQSIPSLNKILSNAKGKNSKENTFYVFVGDFLKNTKLSEEEIYQIFAIEKARYTLILDMIENPDYPVGILLNSKLYENLGLETREYILLENGRKRAIQNLSREKIAAYIDSKNLDPDLKVLPVSTILAVLGC